jgi:tetratricopeptide (TPR) repeat protein
MGREDWYRHTTWTAADQDAFRSRLRRCRSQSSQYVRIQAHYLEQAGLVASAMQLLGEYLERFHDDYQLSMVYTQLATCHERLGEFEEAVSCLRHALAAERARPNVKTNAWLEFGRIAVEHELTDLYGDFLGLVEERSGLPGGLASEAVFPAQRYLLNACLAAIYTHKGETSRGREHAKAALVAAAATTSGFSRHPELGLVRDTTTDLFRRVAAMGADG